MKKIFVKITKLAMVFTMIFSQFCSLITVNAIEKPTLEYDTINKSIKLDLSSLNNIENKYFTYSITQEFIDKGNNSITNQLICSADKVSEITECGINEELDNNYNGKFKFTALLLIYDTNEIDAVPTRVYSSSEIEAVTTPVVDNEIEVTYEVERLNDIVTNEPTDNYKIKFNFDKGDIYTNNNYKYFVDTIETKEVIKDMSSYTQDGIYKFNYVLDIKNNDVSIYNEIKEIEIVIGNVDSLLSEENTTGIEFVSGITNEAKFTYSYEENIPTIADVSTYLNNKGYIVEVKRSDNPVTEGTIQDGDIINLVTADGYGKYSYVVRLTYEEQVVEPVEEVIVEEIIDSTSNVVTTMANTENNIVKEVVNVQTEEINEDKQVKTNAKKDKKEEKENNSAVVKTIVIILIILVIACLVYLIFRDEEKVSKKEDNKKQIKKRK